jgi:hypothetical protein
MIIKIITIVSQIFSILGTLCIVMIMLFSKEISFKSFSTRLQFYICFFCFVYYLINVIAYCLESNSFCYFALPLKSTCEITVLFTSAYISYIIRWRITNKKAEEQLNTSKDPRKLEKTYLFLSLLYSFLAGLIPTLLGDEVDCWLKI